MIMSHPCELISAYLDGELDPTATGHIEQHLGECKACQQLLADYRRIDRRFAENLLGLTAPVPPAAGKRRPASKRRAVAMIAFAVSLLIAVLAVTPGLRAQALRWFAGGLFLPTLDEMAASVAFTVYLPEALPPGANRLPALLSDPDDEGRFRRVEFVWIGAPAQSLEPYLLLSEQWQSTIDLTELMPDGSAIDIQGHPGRLVERKYQDGEREVKDVRLAWTQGDITFYLQSRALKAQQLVELARGMRPVDSARPPGKGETSDRATWYDAGPANQYAIPSVTHFPESHFFLVRLPGEFVAFYDLDPHFRHLVTWDPVAGMFVSPAHGERYTMEGVAVAGPAPRGLDRHPVRVEEGRVRVDLATLLPGKQTGHAKGAEPSRRP